MGTGRPHKQISKRQFEELCKIQCTELEICSVLDVDVKTLDDWCSREYNSPFSIVFRQKREGGKTSLRRAQWLAATQDRNPTMLIWLGKQRLGQKEPESRTKITLKSDPYDNLTTEQ
jgi:hypothetical protein